MHLKLPLHRCTLLAVTACLMFALAGCAPVAGELRARAPDPAIYHSALDDQRRPAADRARDAARLPAELLAFAQIEPGDAVGDYIMGGGYWTRILANVVGTRGRVYAFQPIEFIAFRPAYADEQDAAVAGRSNVTAVRGPIAAPPFPEPLNSLVTVQNFHDLYLAAMPQGTGRRGADALFSALKPGGTLLVVDHSAVAGTGVTAVETLHRIDRMTAIAALTQAGFVLEAESALYARPTDPRSANVFDPAIRGESDQFILRFRKPG